MINKIRLAVLSYSPIRWLVTYKVRRKLIKARTILFVCFGNIYRSPFAQYYAQTLLPDIAKINSSGYHPISGRVCHQKAVDVASEFGVDLSQHRSSVITEDMVKQADIMLTFDEQNRKTLLNKFPFARKKIHYLGHISHMGPVIIDDPIEGNIYTVRATFNIIKRAIDSFVN
jgi:protein-tyrosine phosphatase